MKIFRILPVVAGLFFSSLMQHIMAQNEGISVLSTDKNRFGVAWGFSYGYDSKPEIFLPSLNKMGVHLTKLYLFWQQIEPKKDQFDWNAVDVFLNQLHSSDEALIALWSSSMWATKVPSQTLPPSPAKNSEDYYQFVYQVVKHCKGKIKYWQNDCEPNNPVYWNGTVDDFIHELKIFYKAVKDADPDAKVVMGGYDGLFNPPGMYPIPGQEQGLAFFEKAIRESSSYYDVFDLRLYADPYTIPARVDYFKQKLVESGIPRPIICTEYNGPGFFGFPANLKYVGQVFAWQNAVARRDTAAYLHTKNPVASLYDSILTLAPETQMFMLGCKKELNDKYYRLQCIDLVMRNILMLSSGVRKSIYWDLWHDTKDTFNLMTLMFGKNKLMESENGKLVKEYPQVDVIRRMCSKLQNISGIEKISLSGKDELYLFRLNRTGTAPIYVAWEKRDAFYGDDQKNSSYSIPWKDKEAKAEDIFGHPVRMNVREQQLNIDISGIPVFIEAVR